MARSKQTTCLAVLRALTGMNPARFGETIGRSVSWVTKVESGFRSLPLDVARIIASKTGVSLAWLTAGDASAPCIDALGRPYTIHSWRECIMAPERFSAETSSSVLVSAVEPSDLEVARAIRWLRAEAWDELHRWVLANPAHSHVRAMMAEALQRVDNKHGLKPGGAA